MKTQIDIRWPEGTDDRFATRLRRWANEVSECLAEKTRPDRLSICLYNRMHELEAFLNKEKEALGVVSEGETEFIALHEAWQGYPRIHICRERIENLSETVVQGALQHELTHAFLHGLPKFYKFRFSRQLTAAGEKLGWSLQLIQVCVYLLSIALKDSEVICRLAQTRLFSGQIALLEHMLADTEAERYVWDKIRRTPPQRKIVIASFMKTLLPIVKLPAEINAAGRRLLERWKTVYDWVGEADRREIIRYASETAGNISGSFQDQLEQTALKLITDPRL
jgi:hypothetical protein